MKTKVLLISGLMSIMGVLSVSAQLKPSYTPMGKPLIIQYGPDFNRIGRKPEPRKIHRVKRTDKPIMRKDIRTLPMPKDNRFVIRIR